jgi:hypothetical protein
MEATDRLDDVKQKAWIVQGLDENDGNPKIAVP